jgi:cytochrome c oxidase subunit 2
MPTFSLWPQQASTLAGRVDLLMMFVLGIAVFFAALIAALILFFAIKYHHRTDADRTDPPTQNLTIELIWTAIPLGIVLVLFVWGGQLFVQMRQPPANAIEMYVIAKQWMWKMQHPEGPREINELHVPVGYPVKLVMTSQDVIHSFFVPAFRVKQDVLPGRYTDIWFQATRTGEYHLFCAQYCGTSHSAMIGKIIAMTPADYGRWLGGGTEAAAPPSAGVPAPAKAAAEALNPTMVAAGAGLFKEFKCVDCHKPDRTGKGPPLLGLYKSQVALEGGQTVTANETYIRESILEPSAKIVKGYKPEMPAFKGQLEEDELLQLIAYIKSLKGSK